MARLGIVKGYTLAKNKDGTTKKCLLQVEMIPGDDDSDVRTVEFFAQIGEDSNPPIGSRVLVVDVARGYQIGISSTDDIEPESDSGEKEIYSSDGSSKKAKLKLNLDSEVVMNDGSDYAVGYNDLKTILEQLVSDCNSLFLTAADGGVAGGGLTIDTSSAKVEKVRLP
jgi:hypothetical protein